MFFILSKILLLFIFPLTWVVVLALVSMLTKRPRRKRNFRIAAVVVFYLFSNNVLLNLFARSWDVPPTTIPAGARYSCAIVLGGFSSADRNEQGYFNLAGDRFIQGVKLYKQGIVSHILITGGNGNIVPGAFREGAWTVQQLSAMGVPPEAILIENNSRNTLENGAFTKQLLDSTHLAPPYVLITSGFHMRRSEMVFMRNKMPIVPYPCNYTAGRGPIGLVDLLPTADALSNWSYYIKEVIGYVVYGVKGK